MRRHVIAFDVDGTLRCNCTATCQDINIRTWAGLDFYRHLKNSRIMIWSGGGAEYARQFAESAVQRLDLNRQYPNILKGVHFASKLDPTTWKWGRPDDAIDDMQECELGKHNHIVREK